MFGISQTADFTVDTNSTCVNNTVRYTDISTGSPSSWFWDFGDGASPSTAATQGPHDITYSTSGNKTVSLTINGDAITKNDILLVYSLPVAIIDTIISDKYAWFYYGFKGNDVDIQLSESCIFEWDFGDNVSISDTISNDTSTSITYSSFPFHRYSEEGNYNIIYKVTDNHGCIDSVSQLIDISDKDSLFVPNVFTPNGDNVNDYFIVGSNGYTKFSIVIYSRWGNVVFKAPESQQIVWDGNTIDGSKVAPGVYYYVLTQVDGDKKYLPESGFIHIFY